MGHASMTEKCGDRINRRKETVWEIKCRSKNNVRGWEGVDWIHLAPGRNQ